MSQLLRLGDTGISAFLLVFMNIASPFRSNIRENIVP